MTVAALSLIAWYVATHWQDFAVIGRLSPLVIAAALVLSALVHACSAASVYLVVRTFGAPLAVWEAAMLAVLTRFWNILTPFRGGAFVRAVYLKKAHRLPYVHFMAGLSGMLVTAVFVSILCVWGGLLRLRTVTAGGQTRAIVTLSIALLALGLAMVFHPRLAERGSAIRRQLAKLVNGWDRICRNRRCILALLAVHLLHVATMAAIYGLLLSDMDHPVRWDLLVVVVGIGNISMVLQITPGNIGVYEGALAAVASLMGLGIPAILTAALTWRVLDAMLVLAVGVPTNHVVARRILPNEH